MFELQKASVGYTSLQSLVIANLLPLFGVLWFNWSLLLIYQYFALETILIGIMFTIRLFLVPNFKIARIVDHALWLFFSSALILTLAALASGYFPTDEEVTPPFWSVVFFFIGVIAVQLKQIIQDFLTGHLQGNDTTLHLFEIYSRFAFILVTHCILMKMQHLGYLSIIISIITIFLLKFLLEFFFYANNYINAQFEN